MSTSSYLKSSIVTGEVDNPNRGEVLLAAIIQVSRITPRAKVA